MKYSVKCRVKVRVTKDQNRAGFGWIKQRDIVLEADTIEELTEKAFAIPVPENIDVEAMAIEGHIYLARDAEGKRIKGQRRDVTISVFREL